MNKKLFALIAFVLATGQLQAVPVQELRMWTPYNDFYDLQERFQSIPPAQRERLSFRFRLVPQDPGLTLDQGRFYIMRKNERIEIQVDADGQMRFPRNDQYHQEALPIYTSLAKNQRFGIKAEVLIKLPARQSFQYAELITWMNEASDAMRSRAGLWSIFMPKSTGLDVKLAAAAFATMQHGAGPAERLTPNADGYVFIPFDHRHESENPTVSFSAKPLEALPHYTKNMTLFADGDR